MDGPPPPRRFSFRTIARTGERFIDFAPYAPAVDRRGAVVFQAATREGSGVFAGDGGPIATLADTASGQLRRVVSHPDIDASGAATFYAELPGGGEGVCRVYEGRTSLLADTTGPFGSIGPLGPTVNEDGKVAFRARGRSGKEGIFTVAGPDGRVETVAETGARFASFHGLPVVDADGAVVFRAGLRGGGAAILRAAGGPPSTIVDTAGRFSDLGLFPSAAGDRGVVFAATLASGGAGVFVARDGEIAAIADTSHGFETFRGALIDASGAVVFFATPRGGRLSLFAGPDPVADRLLSIGDPLSGSTITALALNPVSMNAAGQFAVRVELANSEQLVLRADPGD